jgi:hypothetical protein
MIEELRKVKYIVAYDNSVKYVEYQLAGSEMAWKDSSYSFKLFSSTSKPYPRERIRNDNSNTVIVNVHKFRAERLPHSLDMQASHSKLPQHVIDLEAQLAGNLPVEEVEPGKGKATREAEVEGVLRVKTVEEELVELEDIPTVQKPGYRNLLWAEKQCAGRSGLPAEEGTAFLDLSRWLRGDVEAGKRFQDYIKEQLVPFWAKPRN